jgi:predicted AAA+ superfamily ATPase
MFNRSILAKFRAWKDSADRMPLILRGARQVGKTTAVEMFSREYDQFIHLDLEKPKEAALFSPAHSAVDLFQSILFLKGLPRIEGKTLLFIDEIQNVPDAVRMLRYFYEDLPNLHVIAAGSLLEIMLFQKAVGVPVGRVEYAYLHSLTFREYLEAIGHAPALDALSQFPVPHWAVSGLFELFHRFSLVGGMPKIVARYADSKDVVSLKPLYEDLFNSFLEDIPKYASNETMKQVLSYCLTTSPRLAGERIQFANFGGSNYRSREAGEALRLLERAMIIRLLYPTTSTEIPLVPDIRKSPRLQFLDVGLVNFAAGLQGEYFAHTDLHSFYRGKIAEMMVGQELIGSETTTRQPPLFWVREKRQSPAETDFLVQHGSLAVPVEVKAGAAGRLRSLHQFIKRCPHSFAVRLYAGPLEINHLKTLEDKPFTLLNLPYFLAGQLKEYIRRLIEEGGRGIKGA